jgi:hypothetical protein
MAEEGTASPALDSALTPPRRTSDLLAPAFTPSPERLIGTPARDSHKVWLEDDCLRVDRNRAEKHGGPLKFNYHQMWTNPVRKFYTKQ